MSTAADRKAYYKAWYEKNKERERFLAQVRYWDNRERRLEQAKAHSKKRYAADPARKLATTKAWATLNKERRRLVSAQWRESNRGLWNAYMASRKASKIRATPKWLTAEQLQEILDWYEFAAAFNSTVDHIVPLRGKNVCGLHVPWNFQLLTSSENSRKGNRFHG